MTLGLKRQRFVCARAWFCKRLLPLLFRFALKQERFDKLGQWKFTPAVSSEWHKQALSWPVRHDGSINDDHDWPMEAFIVAYAPPFVRKELKIGVSPAGAFPLTVK